MEEEKEHQQQQQQQQGEGGGGGEEEKEQVAAAEINGQRQSHRPINEAYIVCCPQYTIYKSFIGSRSPIHDW